MSGAGRVPVRQAPRWIVDQSPLSAIRCLGGFPPPWRWSDLVRKSQAFQRRSTLLNGKASRDRSRPGDFSLMAIALGSELKTPAVSVCAVTAGAVVLHMPQRGTGGMRFVTWRDGFRGKNQSLQHRIPGDGIFTKTHRAATGREARCRFSLHEGDASSRRRARRPPASRVVWDRSCNLRPHGQGCPA